MVHPLGLNFPVHLKGQPQNDSQRSEAYGPLQGNQTPPVPG